MGVWFKDNQETGSGIGQRRQTGVSGLETTEELGQKISRSTQRERNSSWSRRPEFPERISEAQSTTTNLWTEKVTRTFRETKTGDLQTKEVRGEEEIKTTYQTTTRPRPIMGVLYQKTLSKH